MIKQLQVWKSIVESLTKNIPVMLLYVLESKGSSPGRQGFYMTVNAKGEMNGSIGGGMMEHKFAEMAKEQLLVGSRHRRDLKIQKQIHDKSAARNQSGMICSGEQTIFMYKVSEKDEIHVSNIIRSLEENKNGALMLSANGVQFSEISPEKDFHFELSTEADWTYVEKTGYKNHLYIIGGGHCSLAFSKMMFSMDFFIHLFDDRGQLNTMEQNDFVHEKKLVENYTELADLIPSGKNHYVVIMTFGYRTDGIALKALLHKEFKYLGLLGSQTKNEKMFDELRKEDIREDLLKKIHAPIGIPIKSQTPEEIAVSIAAEIIKVKNN